MDFSFIIVNYRTLELTRACLHSLLARTAKASREIILIDNASGDGSLEALRTEFSGRVVFISNQKNLGFAAANNQGAAMAKGKYLFFLNSDTELTSDPLPALAKIFATQADFGILAPKLLDENGAWQKGACGRFPTVISLLTRATRKNWLKPVDTDMAQTDWVSGAALVIRRDLFEKIGGWDTNYFLYYEDVDLCWRTKGAGARVGLCPAISIIHQGGKSLTQNKDRKRYYYKSQTYFFRKNYGTLTAFAMRVIRWPYIIFKR